MPVVIQEGNICKIIQCCKNDRGVFVLGESEVSNIGAFCIGIDTKLNPSQIRIAFNPNESNNQVQDGDIGLYTAISVSVDGFPIPAAVFPELSYMKNCQEIYNLSHTWPAMREPIYLKDNEMTEDMKPFYILNILAQRPEFVHDDFYNIDMQIGSLTHWPYFDTENDSLIATSVISLGMEFIGPFEEELKYLLNEEGRIPFAELLLENPINNRHEFIDFVLTYLNLTSDQFESVQSYDSMLLFKYLDMEGIASFICAQLMEDKVYLFELENIEVEELQKNRVRMIFEQFKEHGGYRPIDWRSPRRRGKTAGKDSLLYEMDGAVFTLTGRTYAVAIDSNDNKSVWETLIWQVSMQWVAETMSFTKCKIPWDNCLTRPRVVKGLNSAPPCWEKYVKYFDTVNEDEQEDDPHQKIWFDVF